MPKKNRIEEQENAAKAVKPMDHSTAPLFDRLVAAGERRAVSFHVPGHKSGAGAPLGAERWFESVMRLDLTEIPGLDDLHDPQGVILDAQRLAADAFGADRTFFLVGGSTAGNLALILSCCGRGDLLIVQRDAHKSVLHGLMLAGARAVFIRPRIDPDSGLSLGVDEADLRAALAEFPQAKAVLLTHPSYYGFGADLRALADLAHAHGKPLFVDQAHGAHFGWHPRFPASAMQCGADAAVQSAHKMLNALTMGAMLHLRGTRADADRVAAVLAMIQSSSPSYPIMASLDLCRRDLKTGGAERLAAAAGLLDDVRRRIRESGLPFGVVEPDVPRSIADPLKLALYDRTGRMTGYALLDELERRGCVAELADPRHVLLVASAATDEGSAEALLSALRDIAIAEFPQQKQEMDAVTANNIHMNLWPVISEPILFFPPAERAAAASSAKSIPLQLCAGMRSAEMIVPYPPGIPLLFPGELISTAAVELLQALRDHGARIQGASDPSLRTLRVTDGAG